MGIEEKEIIELVSQIEELEQKLISHPLHKVCYIVSSSCFLGSYIV